MSIKYSLIPNHLTDDPNDYMAIVQDQKTRTTEDIIKAMIKRGSTVTKADILSVMEDQQAVVEDFLNDGDSVITPLYKISASISGVFNSQYDDFNRSKHYVRQNMNAGSRISEISRNISVERVQAITLRPVLDYFKDIASDTYSETLTPGGAAEIRGSHLKIDTEDADQGIFFIASDNTETKVTTFIRNMPSNLIFMIPEGLASGEYEVEVRIKPKDNDTDIRKGRLEALMAP